MRFVPLALLLAAGCAAPACQYGTEDAKEMTQDPAKLHAYFIDQIRGGQFANAHSYGLSAAAKKALPYEQFYLVIQWEIVQRMILGFEQHDLRVDKESNTAVVRWCNREFGISREYRMIGQKIGRTKIFWGYDLTREQMQELKDAAFTWFQRQRDAADGRLYTYPPDWRYASVGQPCSCKR